jgi:hypothetical protein
MRNALHWFGRFGGLVNALQVSHCLKKPTACTLPGCLLLSLQARLLTHCPFKVAAAAVAAVVVFVDVLSCKTTRVSNHAHARAGASVAGVRTPPPPSPRLPRRGSVSSTRSHAAPQAPGAAGAQRGAGRALGTPTHTHPLREGARPAPEASGRAGGDASDSGSSTPTHQLKRFIGGVRVYGGVPGARARLQRACSMSQPLPAF